MEASARRAWASRVRHQEMAKQLRAAAPAEVRAGLPTIASLIRYIDRWEASTNGISERYRLLYSAAFDIPTTELFATAGEAFAVTARPRRRMLPRMNPGLWTDPARVENLEGACDLSEVLDLGAWAEQSNVGDRRSPTFDP